MSQASPLGMAHGYARIFRGDHNMHIRRLSLSVALFLLAALFVLLPAYAAAPPSAAFTAYNTTYADHVDLRYTGAVEHRSGYVHMDILATDARFTGSMSMDFGCIALYDHPQALDYMPWGPCPFTWRLGTAAAGWEGVGRIYPQSDARVLLTKATGNGYGAYRHMKIEWTMSAWADTWNMAGTIKGD